MYQKCKKFAAYFICIIVLMCEVPAFSESFREVKRKAENGDAQAQYDLGIMYYKGDGTTKNFNEAFQWWLKAAKQGHARAQCAVGSMYYSQNDAESKREALKWYMKAAENGDAEAQFTMGGFYELTYDSVGLKKDNAEAMKWYRMAAAQNDGTWSKLAQDRLKTEESYLETFRKNLNAADQGDERAQWELGEMYMRGEGTEQDFSQAVKWFRKAEEQDGTFAVFIRYDLALMYQEGKGTEQNLQEAFRLYKKSAEAGYSPSQNNLGVLYDLGLGVKQDKSEAFKWYQKAAAQGYGDAYFNLGVMYDKGQGVKQNKTAAFNNYLKAANEGNIPALFNVALMYHNGEGVKKDYKKAVEWYRKAAYKGIGKAQFNLGTMYYKGEGVKKDKKEALSWWKLAEQSGDPQIVNAVQKYTSQQSKAAKNKSGFWQSLDDLNEILKSATDIMNTFSGRVSSNSDFYSPSAKKGTSKSGKAGYTARTTPLEVCHSCHGDGKCHSCMWSMPSKENRCHACNGTAKCHWCYGEGYR